MVDLPIRLAVLGLGAVAQSVHLPLIRRRSDLFTLVGVADVSEALTAKVGELFGVPAHRQATSLDDLLGQVEVDAVLICSGGSHRDAVVSALGKGVAVLCEKPLAFSRAEIDEIRVALSGEERRRLMVGYMKQYDPAVKHARELLASIDDVRTVDVSVLHPTGAAQLEFARVLAGANVPPEVLDATAASEAHLRTAIIGSMDSQIWPLYSGVLLSSLSHDMSILRLLFGAPAVIDFVDVWRRRSVNQVHPTGRDARALGEHPPSVRVIGQLPRAERFVMDWHYLHDYPAYRETVRIIHGSGSIELAFPSPYLLNAPTVLTVTSSTGEAEARTEYRDTSEAFERQLEAFASMVINGDSPHTTIDGAASDIETSQAVIASWAHRMGIRLDGELRS